MARFRPHPAQTALAVAASAGLTLSSCAAAPRSAEQTSTPPLGLAVAPSSFDAAIRPLLDEPSEPLHAISAESLNALQAYYAENGYAPLWVGMDGLTPRGAQLVTALAKARDAGAPSLQPILIAVDERRTAASLTARAELKILPSGAPLDAAVNTIDPTVSGPPTELLPAANATPDVSGFLRERLPPDATFWRLRDDTAWVDGSGALEFRKDIYARDGELQVASTK